MTEQREFKVGDNVTCEVFRDGVVCSVYPDSQEYYKVWVRFKEYTRSFSIEGYYGRDKIEGERIRHVEEPKKEETTMTKQREFSEKRTAKPFAVGDKVACESFGEGVVHSINPARDSYYEVIVVFEWATRSFNPEGYYNEYHMVSERIRHVDSPKQEVPVDYIQELINTQKAKPITNQGFEEAAQKLAQKLAYALLHEDDTDGVGKYVEAYRRPRQSKALWNRACAILVGRGVVVDTIDVHLICVDKGERS